jgi:hypothetical protein
MSGDILNNQKRLTEFEKYKGFWLTALRNVINHERQDTDVHVDSILGFNSIYRMRQQLL